MFPNIKVVVPQLVYLDSDEVFPEVPLHYERCDIDSMKRAWKQKTDAMLNDTLFVPTPNRFCGWCDYRKAAGGQCEF